MNQNDKKKNISKIIAMATGSLLLNTPEAIAFDNTKSIYSFETLGSATKVRNQLIELNNTNEKDETCLKCGYSKRSSGAHYSKEMKKDDKTQCHKCASKHKKKDGEAKCGEMKKDGEAKCGEMKKDGEAKCGEMKKDDEAKCGEGACGH